MSLEHQRIALVGEVVGEPAATSWQRALHKTQVSGRRRKAFPVGMLAKLLQPVEDGAEWPQPTTLSKA